MELNYSGRRLSASSEEQSIYYIDDRLSPASEAAATGLPDSSPLSDDVPSIEQQQQQLIPRSRNSQQQQQQQQRRRNSTVSSQLVSNNALQHSTGSRPRRQRRPSEFVELQQHHQPGSNSRRNSNCHSTGRSRANSCARPTPLGILRLYVQ